MRNASNLWWMVVFVLGCHAESWRAHPSTDDIPKLTHELRECDDRSRAAAAETLARLGAEGKPSLGQLVLALRDESEMVRQNALRAIITIGPDDKAIGALSLSLRDSDDVVRELSASALGQLGPAARQSIPA